MSYTFLRIGSYIPNGGGVETSLPGWAVFAISGAVFVGALLLFITTMRGGKKNKKSKNNEALLRYIKHKKKTRKSK